mgnify:CR=1 FL=1
MKFSNVRLLVRDYEKCFRFYTEKLGLEAAFDIEGCYGSFKVAEGIEGLAIFTADRRERRQGAAGRLQG